MTTPTTTNPIASGGAGAGLWIRVAANLSRRKVTWRLTEACLAQFPVPPGAPRSLMQKAAMGFLQELWGNIAEHTLDGRIAHLPDAQLEQWAGWDGEAGVFARWLRDAHIDTETGCVREWDEFAGVLQAKRVSDAQRQRDKRNREKAARALLEESAGGEVERKAGPSVRSSDSVERTPPIVKRVALSGEDVTELARRCTIALNKGLNDNVKLGGSYMPVHAGRGDSHEFVMFLAADGIADWDLVERAVYTIAKGFEPEKRGDQIRSLTFCRDRALAICRRAIARAEAERAGPIAEVPASRGKSGKRVESHLDSTSRSARSAAGAMAAASAVGLSDD